MEVLSFMPMMMNMMGGGPLDFFRMMEGGPPNGGRFVADCGDRFSEYVRRTREAPFPYNRFCGGGMEHSNLWKGRRLRIKMHPSSEVPWREAKVLSFDEYLPGPFSRETRWVMEVEFIDDRGKDVPETERFVLGDVVEVYKGKGIAKAKKMVEKLKKKVSPKKKKKKRDSNDDDDDSSSDCDDTDKKDDDDDWALALIEKYTPRTRKYVVKLAEDRDKTMRVAADKLRPLKKLNLKIHRINIEGGGVVYLCGEDRMLSFEWLEEASPKINLKEEHWEITCPTCREKISSHHLVEMKEKEMAEKQRQEEEKDQKGAQNETDDEDLKIPALPAKRSADEMAKSSGEANSTSPRRSPRKKKGAFTSPSKVMQCPICLEEKDCETLPCSHIVCEPCLSAWIKKKNEDHGFKVEKIVVNSLSPGDIAKQLKKNSKGIPENRIEDGHLDKVMDDFQDFFNKLSEEEERTGDAEAPYFEWKEWLMTHPIELWGPLPIVEKLVKNLGTSMAEILIVHLESMRGTNVYKKFVKGVLDECKLYGDETFRLTKWPSCRDKFLTNPDNFHDDQMYQLTQLIGEKYEEDDDYHSAIRWYEKSLKYIPTETPAQSQGEIRASALNNVALAQKRAGLFTVARDTYKLAMDAGKADTGYHVIRNQEILEEEIKEWVGTSGVVTPRIDE